MPELSGGQRLEVAPLEVRPGVAEPPTVGEAQGLNQLQALVLVLTHLAVLGTRVKSLPRCRSASSRSISSVSTSGRLPRTSVSKASTLRRRVLPQASR